MDKRNRDLIKNTSILTFGVICTKGIMFIMTPLFIRWLSQSDYGTFDFLINYVTLVIPLITLNVGEAVFRLLIDQADNESKTIVSCAIISDMAGMIFSIIIVGCICLFLPQYGTYAVYFFIVLLCETIYNFLGMVMRGLKCLPLYNIANIIYVFSMALSAFIFVKLFDMGLLGIFLAYSFGYAVSSFYMAIVSQIKKYFSWKYFDVTKLKYMLKYSLPLIPNAVGWWVINISDRTIVSLILGVEANAVLAVTHKLPNLCQTLYSRFNLSWQQSAAETIDNKDRDKFYSEVLNSLIHLMSSLVVILLSANIFFFNIVYTEDYFKGYYIAPILLIAMLIYMIAQFLGGIYNARLESYKNGITTVIGAVVNIMVHLLFVGHIGLFAAVISTLISYIVVLVARFLDIRKYVSLRLEKSSIICFVVTAFFFVFVYIGNDVFHYFCILPAFGFAILMNFTFVCRAVDKVKKDIMKR